MAVLIHAFSFVTESGFDRNVAAAGLSIDGFGNLVSKVAWGWGLGRFSPRLLVPVAFGVSATGVTLIPDGRVIESAGAAHGRFLFLWFRVRRYNPAVRVHLGTILRERVHRRDQRGRKPSCSADERSSTGTGGRVVRRRRGLSVSIRGSYSVLLRSRRAGRCVQGPSGLDARTYVREPDGVFLSLVLGCHS